MTTHTITKGCDLRLAGAPERKLLSAPPPAQVILETSEYPGIKPKALVKDGAPVTIGQPLFLDKMDRDVVFCSPVAGTVKTVVYGERRFLQRVVIENAAASGQKEQFAAPTKPGADRASLRKSIKNAGLWPLFLQRPLGKMPRTEQDPVAIFVNGMDSAPLSADPAFATAGMKAELQRGVELLQQLTDGKVYLCLRAGGADQSELRDLKGVVVHDFAGPHPSGLTGTHIRRIQPLKPGQIAYALRAQDVARLGSWAITGKYPGQITVAVSGSAASKRGYLRVPHGAPASALNGGTPFQGDVRIIDGNVLHGRAIGNEDPIGIRCSTLTVIPEGTGQRDLFGWALPQFGKLSLSRSVFNWLMPKKEYVLDARLNGGHRPIVNIGSWERVMDLDIHPSYLVRAIQANDIEEAVKLGLLEVTEEDVALCTFADPCKIDVGQIIRTGLDMFEKEG